MKREILTPIPLEELEEIRRRSGAMIRLELSGNVRKNGIPFNVVIITGEEGEIRKFLEFLMRARAGG